MSWLIAHIQLLQSEYANWHGEMKTIKNVKDIFVNWDNCNRNFDLCFFNDLFESIYNIYGE